MRPAFDPTKPYEVLDKPKFDPSKPFEPVVFSKPDPNAPKPKVEITQEMVMDMIQGEIRKAISSQRVVERVIEKKIIEKEVPRDVKTVEKIVIDEESKKKIGEMTKEIEQVRQSINFIIPKRSRVKKNYEITNADAQLRSFDVTSATVDQLYQVVGTLIADLKAAKILS